MLPLETLQSRLAHSVLRGNAAGLAGILSCGNADSYARLRIYQNNTLSSLTKTLMAVFPVTVRLVDERFFRYAASVFIRQNPPAEPRLVRYGADFPRFLRTFKPLTDLPFVAETARVEWAIAEVLDAEVLPAAAPSQLQDAIALNNPYLALQPSLRLLVSHWPALSIWMAHQKPGISGASGDWAPGTERIAVWRCGENVRFLLLGRAEFAFRHALAHGQCLERAVSRALAEDQMFDLAPALVRLFQDSLVTGIATMTHQTPIEGVFHDHDD